MIDDNLYIDSSNHRENRAMVQHSSVPKLRYNFSNLRFVDNTSMLFYVNKRAL